MIRVEPQITHERRQQNEERHRDIAVDPGREEPVHQENFLLPLLRLRRHHVAEARHQRVKNDMGKIGDGIDDLIVIIHKAGCLDRDEGRNDEGIGLRPRHIADFHPDERLHLGPDHRGFPRIERLRIFFGEIRIAPVQIPVHEEFLRELHEHVRQQICVEALRRDQNHDLRRRRDELCHRRDVGLNIISLLRIAKTVFIGDKIPADRIEQEDEVVQGQIPPAVAARVPDEDTQKRRERQPDSRDHKADRVIRPRIRPHQRLDLLPVLLRHRLVQGEVHRRPDAELRDVQHRQNARVQTVDAVQCIPQLRDENLLENKAEDRRGELPDVSEQYVFGC